MLPNIILGCTNILIICSLIAFLNIRELPFSDSEDRQGKNIIKSILMFVIPATIGFCHYYIFDYIWTIVILALSAPLILWLIFNFIKKLGWNKIK